MANHHSLQSKSDATKNQAAGQAARELAWFAIAEHAAGIGHWRQDFTDNSLSWSPGMYRLMGIDPQQQPDHEWLRVQMPEQEQRQWASAVAAARRDGGSFSHRARGVTLGPLLPGAVAQIIDTKCETERGPDGRPIAMIGACRNVTGSVCEEEARDVVNEQYRAMMREASDIIFIYDGEGRLLCASDAFERVHGRASESKREDFVQFVHQHDMAEGNKIKLVPAPDETITATYRFRHRDGHYRWMETLTRAMYEDGRVKNIISVSRDITTRKQQQMDMQAAQSRAEAANQAKSRFLANMSHELRTPLNAIMGFTDLMRQKLFGPLGDPHYEEYTTIIHDSGQHLLDLITDILDMAKIEAGKMQFNMECVDIDQMIEDVVRLLQNRADSGGVMLTVSPMDAIFLTADKRAVRQVLTNLLSNAIKFTPPGGHVTIWVEQENGRARLMVRDTGIGIAASDLKRLGNPFEQVQVDAYLAHGGTGLGLALVKALVRSHGGKLSIQSVENSGTTVNVDFALETKAQAAA